jgi:DNA polymerase III subunit epsilon
MRQIIVDTETTGLDPKQGHRIIEIAAVEVVNRRATGQSMHFYVDPERDIDVAATEVHGKTWDDLKGMPRFADVAPQFLDFARGAEWVIHNAPFDVSFLDSELGLAGLPPCSDCYGKLTDTLTLARETFPGKRNSLDALCERFTVDYCHRSLHGALVDANLLAEVWLAMTRGQDSLTIDIAVPIDVAAATIAGTAAIHAKLIVIEPSADELALHAAYLEALAREARGRCVWLALASEPEAAPNVGLAQAA